MASSTFNLHDLQHGYEDAWHRFLDMYHPKVFAYLLTNVGEQEVAEDLLMDSMCRIATQIKGLSTDTSLEQFVWDKVSESLDSYHQPGDRSPGASS